MGKQINLPLYGDGLSFLDESDLNEDISFLCDLPKDLIGNVREVVSERILKGMALDPKKMMHRLKDTEIMRLFSPTMAAIIDNMDELRGRLPQKSINGWLLKIFEQTGIDEDLRNEALDELGESWSPRHRSYARQRPMPGVEVWEGELIPEIIKASLVKLKEWRDEGVVGDNLEREALELCEFLYWKDKIE